MKPEPINFIVSGLDDLAAAPSPRAPPGPGASGMAAVVDGGLVAFLRRTDALASTALALGNESAYSAAVAAYEAKGLSTIYHDVTPTDTVPGLALKYNVSAAELKRVNSIQNDHALFAHARIVIPGADATARLDVQPIDAVAAAARDALVGRLQVLAKSKPGFTAAEAPVYLDLAEWDLDLAVAELDQTKPMPARAEGVNYCETPI